MTVLETAHAAFQSLLDARGVRKLHHPHDRSGWRKVINSSERAPYFRLPFGQPTERRMELKPKASKPRGRYKTVGHRYVATAGDDAAFEELERIRTQKEEI